MSKDMILSVIVQTNILFIEPLTYILAVREKCEMTHTP